MTKRQKQAHIEMIQKLVAATGFELDRYSNWIQKLEAGIMRVKFKSTNIRIELKRTGSGDWHKVVSKPIVKFLQDDFANLVKTIKYYDTPQS
jgi:hypothetical protein